METKKILRIINRKAIFSVAYLVLAVAFIFAYFYFWDFHKSDYAYNSASYVSLLDHEFIISPGFLFGITAILYFLNFLCGAFFGPNMYRHTVNMNIKKFDPESEFTFDWSILRGIPMCLLWSALFVLAFYDTIPVLTYVIVFSWILLHVVLILVTGTNWLFTRTTKTVDLVILFPEDYQSGTKEHNYVDLYFYTPKGVDENAWNEKYLKEYVKEKRAEKERIKEFSEKAANS